eukprot:6474863-Amphidinium_carterae.1
MTQSINQTLGLANIDRKIQECKHTRLVSYQKPLALICVQKKAKATRRTNVDLETDVDHELSKM